MLDNAHLQHIKELEQKILQLEEDNRSLQENDLRINAVIANSVDGIAITDERGYLIGWNASLEEILGIMAADVVGRYFWDVQYQMMLPEQQTPETLDHIKTSIQTLLESGTIPWVGEQMVREYIHPDGSRRLIQGVVFSIKTARGFVLVSFSRDMTDQNQTAYDLQGSEEKFKQLVETMRDVFWVASSDWDEIYYVSSTYEQVWGHSVSSLYQEPRSWLDAVHEDDREAVLAAVKKKSEYGVANPDFPEYRIIRPDGATRWIKARAYPVFDDNGQVVRVSSIAEDITERNLAELGMQKRSSEMVALNALSTKVGRTLSVDQVTTNALDGVLQATQASAAFLLMRKEENLIPVQVVFSDPDRKSDEFPLNKLGACICGMAVNQGKALYSANIYDDKRCTWDECKQAGLTAVAALPLFSGEEIIAVLGLGADVSRNFEDQAKFLETIAVTIAVSLQNAMLFEAESKRRLEADSLRRAIAALTASLNLQQLLKSILDGLAEVIPYDSASLFMSESDGQRLIAGNGYPDPGKLIGKLFPLNDYFSKIVIDTRQPLILADASADPKFLSWGDVEYIRGWMVIPLTVREEVIGRLSVDSRNPNTYNQSHADLALAYANQAAIAIDNARLFESVQRHAAELEQRVSERTAAINLQIEDVEQLNSALTNLLEDFQSANESLAITSQQLKETNQELEAFTFSVSHDLRAPLRAVSGFSQILKEDYSKHLPDDAVRYLDMVNEGALKMDQLITDLLDLSRIGRASLSMRMYNLKELAEEVIKELSVDQVGRSIDFIVEEIPDNFVDSTLLKQVFVNLISNAIKFTKHEEIAKIHIGFLIDVDDSWNEIIYFVRDNGVGFSMEYIDKLFGVFQRLHSEKSFEGTGVGLAIVKRIIQRHGGNVWAEGEVGQGATFYFTIPKAGD